MENSESSNNVAPSTPEVRSETETPSVPSTNAESIHRTPPRIRVRRFESLSSGPPNLLSPCTNEQVDTDEPPRVRVRIQGEVYSLSSLQFGNLAPYPSALPPPSMNVPAATPFATPNVPFLFQGSSERSTFNPYETIARYHNPVVRAATSDNTRASMVPPPRPLRSTGTRSANLDVAPTSTEPSVLVIDADDDASNDEPVEEMETDGEPENEPEVQQPPPVNDPKPSTSCPSALSSVDDGDSGTVCTICYSPYTNSGDHRISCLKCGHIFGQSCIKRWFKNGCQNSNKRCPSCNAKASVRDLRTIFASNLVALDTTEKDELIEKLHKLQNEKNLTESVLNSERLKNEQLTEQIRKYEAKIKELSTNGNLREQNEVVQKVSIFNSKMLSSFSLCSEGACRVLAYTSQLSLLLASQAAASVIPSYGIRKINMHDMKPTSYHHIHQKTIRDMSFSPFERGHLLSVSLDRTAKLYDTQSNIVVQTFTTPVALWSCTWSSVDSNKFYCGGQNGTWFAFDKRQPRLEPQEIVETSDDKDKSGILSMSHIPPRPGRFMPNGGVIACRLNQIVAHYTSGDEIVKKVLPIEGPFMSMQYNRRNDHLLISAKASKNKWNTSRHMVCQLSELNGVEGDYDGIDILQTFNGSPMCEVLSRSTFVPFPNGDLTVCAHNQRNASMDLWSVVSGSKLPFNDVHLNEPIYDIASFSVDDKDLIIPCLSAKKLSVIKLSF